MKRIATLIVILSITLATSLTGLAADEPLVKTKFLMGTVCTIKLYDKKEEAIAEKAFARIAEIEKKVSANAKDTEIDAINIASGVSAVTVSQDTFYLIKRGLEYGVKSNGSFEITIGPLVQLWRIGFSDARVPSQPEIDTAISQIGYQDVTLNEAERSVYLKDKNMKLDLGAIAKGYATDAVIEVLRAEGVKSAIVDLGGNLYCLGKKSNGLWNIGIQDPNLQRNETLGTIKLADKSIVTSGIYERFLEKDGKRYHHLLNPFTGYPYDNGLASVTIISNLSVDGDGLSTTVFTKGLTEGLAYVESLKDVEAIFVTADNKVYVSNGLKNQFVLTSKKYTLEKSKQDILSFLKLKAVPGWGY